MDTESRMTLRLPTELYEWIKADAEQNRRSLNSQVVEVLDAYRKQRKKEQHDAQPSE